MDSNGHNGIKGLRVLLSGPAADGVATMLAHQPAISLVRPTGLAETQTSADVALHVLESSSVHGELPHARELRVPLILAAYGEPNGISEAALEIGAADVLVLPQSEETLLFALRKAARATGRTWWCSPTRPGWSVPAGQADTAIAVAQVPAPGRRRGQGPAPTIGA